MILYVCIKSMNINMMGTVIFVAIKLYMHSSKSLCRYLMSGVGLGLIAYC